VREAIPQKNPDIRTYISTNTIFPHKLAEFSKNNGNKMIHITTDCVFSGKKGNYTETDKHDAEDIYGISKSLGEPIDICIIRTSIIGEEFTGKKSLIEWIKSCKNGRIEGYGKFYWNGITCLELAKIILNIIKTNTYWYGVRHFFAIQLYQNISYVK
jgi:dTDP-4-dehydrorhamnose reductase